MAFSSSPLAHAHAGGANGGTTGSIDTTGADLFVLTACWFTGTTSDVTISDSKGNPIWLPLGKYLSADHALALGVFYCPQPTVGSGHTFTASGTSSFVSFDITAWSGSALSPFDNIAGTAGAGSNSATSLSTGSLTPSQDNSLIVSAMGSSATTGSFSVNSGLTISDQQLSVGGAREGSAQAYLIQGAAAAINPQWSQNNAYLVVAVAAFMPAVVSARGMPFGRGAAFNGGRCFVGPLN